MSDFLSMLFPANRYQFIPAEKLSRPEWLEVASDAGEESITFDLAPWPNVMLFDAVRDYTREWVIPEKCDLGRTIGIFRHAIRILNPAGDIEKMGRAESRHYAQVRKDEGIAEGSIRRELTIIKAALRHAYREERTKVQVKFQMPAASSPRLRFLTREEFKRLMASPKPPRLHRFLTLAFGTGARARAIEELTWDRVNLAERTIDFRIPGVRYKNKRRVVVPINDWLLPRLQVMHERRGDDYVVGLGPSGRCTSTYHMAAAALKAVGISDAAPRHVARHTFASWLLQADPPASIYEVALLLGDKVAMVEKVYGHLQSDHLLRASNRLH